MWKETKKFKHSLSWDPLKANLMMKKCFQLKWSNVATFNCARSQLIMTTVKKKEKKTKKHPETVSPSFYQDVSLVNVSPLNITYLALKLFWCEIFLLLQQQNKVLIHWALNWGWDTESDPWSNWLNSYWLIREGEFKWSLTGVSQHHNKLVVEQLAGLLVAHTLHYLLLLITKPNICVVEVKRWTWDIHLFIFTWGRLYKQGFDSFLGVKFKHFQGS